MTGTGHQVDIARTAGVDGLCVRKVKIAVFVVNLDITAGGGHAATDGQCIVVVDADAGACCCAAEGCECVTRIGDGHTAPRREDQGADARDGRRLREGACRGQIHGVVVGRDARDGKIRCIRKRDRSNGRCRQGRHLVAAVAEADGP